MYLVTVLPSMIMLNENAKTLFVQKPILANCIESNMEGEIDMENQLRIKKLPNPVTIREPASKIYVDNKINDPSIVKNTERYHQYQWWKIRKHRICSS